MQGTSVLLILPLWKTACNILHDFDRYQIISLHDIVMMRSVSHFGIHEGRQLWASLSFRDIHIKDNHSFHLYFFKVSIHFSARDNLEKCKGNKNDRQIVKFKWIGSYIQFQQKDGSKKPKNNTSFQTTWLNFKYTKYLCTKKNDPASLDYLAKQSREFLTWLSGNNCTYD